MIMNRLKSLIRDVSKCLFLHFLGFTFFATPNSLGSNFENTATGTCRFVIPILKEHQEVQLGLNFLYVTTLPPPQSHRCSRCFFDFAQSQQIS